MDDQDRVPESVLADICVDCNSEAHCAYMVTSEVYDAAGLREDQPCCLICLQKRLGRKLDYMEFNFASPCNLFLPGTIATSVLFKVVGDLLPDGTPYRKRRLVVNSVLRLRRQHPQGLTMWQVADWVRAEFGIEL